MIETGFLPISIATLVPETTVGMDLYQICTQSQRPILYRDQNYPLNSDDLLRLRQRGVKCLYIPADKREAYQTYLRQVAEGSAETGNVSISTRVGALNEVVRDVLRSSFHRDNLDETVVAANELAELACNLVTCEDFTSSDLFQVLHHDYTTFTHSANVAMYCAMLADALGFTVDEVREITIGGLLHDLGKLAISETILCKPGRLDDEEFRIVRTHPTVGFRRLFDRKDLTFGQMMMVYQHHERLDGRGYPVGAVDKDIHPWARICAVVDVFEAITSERPYRTPMPHNQALALLKREADSALDKEMVQCWTMTIQTNSES